METEKNEGLRARLNRWLGHDPSQADWPREILISGGGRHWPAVFDGHNALLTIRGASPADFKLAELEPCLNIGNAASSLCSRLVVWGLSGNDGRWEALGFQSEGAIAGYWPGGGDAQLWALNGGARATEATDELQVQRRTAEQVSDLPAGWVCRTADSSTPDDALDVRNLLQCVFPTYPIPDDAGTIRYAWAGGEVHGRLVRDADGILAAYASAEFQEDGGAVEITDCATAPHARGRGLMTHLVQKLQADLDEVYECRNAFALARADQPDIHRVFARRGWLKTGCLVNHFRLAGRWCSAWLWVSPPRRNHR